MSNLRNHLYYIYLAFTRYKKGFLYLWMRYIVAPKILSREEKIEKPITHKNLSIHMLFGSRDFLMACWSLASWYANSHVIGQLYIHSDGTLNESQKSVLKKLFPTHSFIDASEVVDTHKTFFEKHPTAHSFRKNYKKFQSKKLLDPYLSSDKPMRLILDSDMLWFKNPEEIESNLASGTPRAMMMSDGDGEYAYVTFKDGTKISKEIAGFNSGITLYRKDQFDISALEDYINKVDYMNTRFTDQACYATILKPHLVMLPKDRYILKGALTENIVMRHYTGPQRAKFYLLGLDRIWKNIL